MKTIYNIHSVSAYGPGRETEEQYFTRLANERTRQRRAERRNQLARKLGLRRPERRPAA
jgi:hypothetical protein